VATIRDAEEAVLLGSAQVEGWRSKFLEEWYQPYKSMMVNKMLRSLTPDQLAILKARSGEAYEKVRAGFNVQEENKP
jgi:hypothetical protein